MTTIKVGVARVFATRIASFLGIGQPGCCLLRRGETLGVYVPTRPKSVLRQPIFPN